MWSRRQEHRPEKVPAGFTSTRWLDRCLGFIPIKRALLALALHALAMGQGVSTPVNLAKQQWNGNAICYSGYRVGQHPDKQLFPSETQVLEDLRILEKHWRLIRVYGSDRHSRDVLEVIQRNGLRLHVMLGVWLSGKPEKQAENKRQLAYGIQLAKKYPGVVAAMNVGNEALVSWSDHRMTEEAMLECVRLVKASVKCPVTVADDFLYWIQPGNKLVKYLDFITLHSYPLWGNQDIDQGLPSTVEKFALIRRAYPEKTIVFGEVGWASFTESNSRHVPRAGDEIKQKRYFEEINAWAKEHGVTTFLFEAFDEPWKGDGTEGHWGVFSVERKAKRVMWDLYPDLISDRPTSPSYELDTGSRTKLSGNQ